MIELRRQEGQGLVSALLILSGVLLPILFLVPLFGKIEQGRLAAAQAAREAVRSAVIAPTADGARTAAENAVTRAREQTGIDLRLTLEGQFERGSILRAQVSAPVSIGHLPGLGDIGTITVRSHAAAPVDRYRSLDPEAEP